MKQIPHEALVSQEISSLEEQMRVAIDMRAKVSEATEDLKKRYESLIYSKEGFERIRKQNTEEIRLYRLAITCEAKEIESTFKRMIDTVSSDRLSQLKEFASVCERIKSLRDEGFFSAIKIDA